MYLYIYQKYKCLEYCEICGYAVIVIIVMWNKWEKDFFNRLSL